MGIIALLATTGTSSSQINKCIRSREILDINLISYEVINGTDPDAAEARNLLFKLSKQFANYPLFFYEYEDNDTIKFIGNYIDLEILNYYHKIPGTIILIDSIDPNDDVDQEEIEVSYEECRTFLKSINRKEMSKHFGDKVLTDDDYTSLFECVVRTMKTKDVPAYIPSGGENSTDDDDMKQRVHQRQKRQSRRLNRQADDIKNEPETSYEISTMSPTKSRIKNKVNQLDMNRIDMFDNSYSQNNMSFNNSILFSPEKSPKKKHSPKQRKHDFSPKQQQESHPSSTSQLPIRLPDAPILDNSNSSRGVKQHQDVKYISSASAETTNNLDNNATKTITKKNHDETSTQMNEQTNNNILLESHGKKKSSYLINAAAASSRSPSPNRRNSNFITNNETLLESPSRGKKKASYLINTTTATASRSPSPNRRSSQVESINKIKIPESFIKSPTTKRQTSVSPIRKTKTKTKDDVSTLRPGMVRGTSFDDIDTSTGSKKSSNKKKKERQATTTTTTTTNISPLRPGLVRGISFDEDDNNVKQSISQSTKPHNDYNHDNNNHTHSPPTTNDATITVNSRRISNLRPGMLRGKSFDEEEMNDNMIKPMKRQQQQENSGVVKKAVDILTTRINHNLINNDEQQQQKSKETNRRVSTLSPGMVRGTSFDETTEDLNNNNKSQQEQQQGITKFNDPPGNKNDDDDDVDEDSSVEQNNHTHNRNRPVPSMRPGMVRGTSFDETTEDLKHIMSQHQQHGTQKVNDPRDSTNDDDDVDEDTSVETNNHAHNRTRPVPSMRPGMVRGLSFDDNDDNQQHPSNSSSKKNDYPKNNDGSISKLDDLHRSAELNETKTKDSHDDNNNDNDHHSVSSSESDEEFWRLMSRSGMVRGLSYENLEVEKVEGKPSLESKTKSNVTEATKAKANEPSVPKDNRQIENVKNMAVSSHSRGSYSTYDTNCSSTVSTKTRFVPITSSTNVIDTKATVRADESNNNDESDSSDHDVEAISQKGNAVLNKWDNIKQKSPDEDDESIPSSSISSSYKRSKPRKYLNNLTLPSKSKQKQKNVEPSPLHSDAIKQNTIPLNLPVKNNISESTLSVNDVESKVNKNVEPDDDNDLSKYRIKRNDSDSSDDSEEFWTSMRPKMQRGLSIEEFDFSQLKMDPTVATDKGTGKIINILLLNKHFELFCIYFVSNLIVCDNKGDTAVIAHVSNQRVNSHLNSFLTEQTDNVQIAVDWKVDGSVSEKIDSPGKPNFIDNNVRLTPLSHGDDNMKNKAYPKLEEKNIQTNKSEKNSSNIYDNEVNKQDRSPKSDKRKKSKKIPFDPKKLMFVELQRRTTKTADGTIISEITTEDDFRQFASTSKQKSNV